MMFWIYSYYLYGNQNSGIYDFSFITGINILPLDIIIEISCVCVTLLYISFEFVYEGNLTSKKLSQADSI